MCVCVQGLALPPEWEFSVLQSDGKTAVGSGADVVSETELVVRVTKAPAPAGGVAVRRAASDGDVKFTARVHGVMLPASLQVSCTRSDRLFWFCAL